MKIDVSLAQSAGLDTTRFPHTKQEVELAEQAVAEALAKLSLDDHERILLDAHGVSDDSLKEDRKSSCTDSSCTTEGSANSADPREALLQQLDEEIRKIHTDNEAYKMAIECQHSDPSSLSFATSRWFRLLFLRAEQNDTAKAAAALVAHFQVKQQLFGEASLARHVRYSDLSAKAQEILRSGIFQVWPDRDKAGRIVVAVNPCMMFQWDGSDNTNANKKNEDPRTNTPLRQAVWYFHMELLRQEWETALFPSEKGVVVVIYHYEPQIFRDVLKLHFHRHQKHRMASVLPIRIDATHFCHNSTLLRPLFAGIQLFIDPYSRFRLLSHCGNIDSVHETLFKTFGIPTNHSPMAPDASSWSIQNHLEFIEKLRQRDEDLSLLERRNSLASHENVAKRNQDRVDCTATSPSELFNQPFVPQRFDVLFGKDKTTRLHTGNLRAMHLCDMYWNQYEAAGKYGKTDIAERIVAIIHESSGRFWKENSGIWEEATDKEARQKIAHFFRQKRSDRKKQTESNA